MPSGVPRSLRRCVGDADRFLREAWQCSAHLHRRRGDDDFADLLSFDDVDRILATMSPRPPAFRLVRAGNTLPRASYTRSGTLGGQRLTDLPDIGRVLKLFDEGATIVLQGLHRYWEPVTRFCRELEAFLTQPVQANAYLTPPVATGLNVHHDIHDVFAMQTFGRKHWVTYAPVVDDPVASQRWDPSLGDPGEPVLDVELAPGDCLYVPRGMLHAARTVDTASLHLTLGIRSVTWHDLFTQVVTDAADEVRFRQALPAGYATDPAGFAGTVSARLKELATWIEERDGGKLAARLADRFWASRPPVLDGQLRQLLDLDALDQDSRVSRRDGAVAHLDVRDGRAHLQLGDRRLTLPAELEPVIGRLLSAQGLRVGDLTELDEDSRVVLVRRLIREGLLVAGGE
ncbi:MAG: cupin domain-containing protein [Actinobacteria bacterium]|nr:cupin domain-containing protein [Actinomycetota bacterium]